MAGVERSQFRNSRRDKGRCPRAETWKHDSTRDSENHLNHQQLARPRNATPVLETRNLRLAVITENERELTLGETRSPPQEAHVRLWWSFDSHSIRPFVVFFYAN